MATKKKTTSKSIKVEILGPVAGKFLLPYNVGQVVTLESKQAEELINAGYAKKA